MLGFNNSRTPRATNAAAQARARCAARSHGEATEELDEPGTAGWFDSSHALSDGLTVVEHDGLEGEALELAVALWLQ